MSIEIKSSRKDSIKLRILLNLLKLKGKEDFDVKDDNVFRVLYENLDPDQVSRDFHTTFDLYSNNALDSLLLNMNEKDIKPILENYAVIFDKFISIKSRIAETVKNSDKVLRGYFIYTEDINILPSSLPCDYIITKSDNTYKILFSIKFLNSHPLPLADGEHIKMDGNYYTSKSLSKLIKLIKTVN